MAGRFVINLDELERELGSETRDILLDLSNDIINELKRNSPRGATGDLARSWSIFFRGDSEVVLGSNISYASYVDTGTAPHTPPFAPIQKWARRKLGDESAAWPVWQKIREEGTDPNPYIDESIETAIDNLR
jgi:hypothetical protein